MSKEQIKAQVPIKLLLTVEEAAQALGLGRTVFYELMMRGKIASVKIGYARRVPFSALQAFVQELLEEQVQQ